MENGKSNKLIIEILNKKNDNGQTTLTRAIRSYRPEMVKVLTDFGAKADLDVFMPTFRYLNEDQISSVNEIIRILLGAHTKLTDVSVYNAIIAKHIDKSLILKMISMASTFETKNYIIEEATRYSNDKEGNFFNWLAGSEYDSDYLKAALDRTVELHQNKLIRQDIKALPTFFSSPQKILAFKEVCPKNLFARLLYH